MESDAEDQIPLAERKAKLVRKKMIVDSDSEAEAEMKPTAAASQSAAAAADVKKGEEPGSSSKSAGKRQKVESSPKKRPLERTAKKEEDAAAVNGGGSSRKRAKVEVSSSSAAESDDRDEDEEADEDDDEDESFQEDDEDDVPLAKRKTPVKKKSKVVVERKTRAKKITEEESEEDEDEADEDDEAFEEEDEDDIPLAKRKFGKVPARKKTTTTTTTKKKKVAKVVVEKKTRAKPGTTGAKWSTLEHSGVMFPPAYSPHGIKMLYDGKPIELTPEAEEVATMFAVMKDTDYATKPTFISNFWADWKKILGDDHIIQELARCDFTPIYDWHMAEKEKKKQLTTEEKKRLKEEKTKAEERFTWALIDGAKEKVGNFRVEPPGLFRGRGEHPKMGKLKRRIFPEDIVINIGKEAPVPECPMPGHRWKEVRHDNTVTWLAFWNDPINVKESKYVFLHQSSSLKAKSDEEKYDKARKLTSRIDSIRESYIKDFKAKDPDRRQIAVATYLIDRLALRAGNEKDDDEADTVGCCSLKVEHVKTHRPDTLEFDFLGKDSIRYQNTVKVEVQVFKAIEDFKRNKQDGEDLFDRLDTTRLNAHLKKVMPGLTAKVFRTYNASYTLETQLKESLGSSLNEKTAEYSRANKEVAVLCNHQRSVSKNHGAQMERLEGKISEVKTLREELMENIERVKKGEAPVNGSSKRAQSQEQMEKKLVKLNERLAKMNLDMSLKDDMKTVALGTSKINYMDPRITVAWCKRHEVPIEKVFNKSLLAKFAWAMTVDPGFKFCDEAAADGDAEED